MADNYIERKMEELEARKAMPKKPVSNRAGHKRRVFVTGGASGIGKAIVKAFSNEGYRVAFCDRDAEQGKETSKETGALFFPADVSDKEALESCLQQLFDRWGDVDVLIFSFDRNNSRRIRSDFVDQSASGLRGFPLSGVAPEATDIPKSLRAYHQSLFDSLPDE